MGLILGIAAAASVALAVWRGLAKQGTAVATGTIVEYRRTSGIVNAISYALSIVLDAMSMRRSASHSVSTSGPVRVREMGRRAGGDD